MPKIATSSFGLPLTAWARVIAEEYMKGARKETARPVVAYRPNISPSDPLGVMRAR